ncbi:MAG: tetratricopeptide repeat protein [Rhodocyclaceae bacterium]|nr:tetratricopeptide repeat protein [Rhodocyclaceae bacterium]
MSAGPTLAEAALLHDSGQFDAARRAYRSILDAQPDSARVLYLLGLLEKASGDREQSMSCLQQAIAADPMQADVWMAIGDLHAETGADALATEAFERCVARARGSALGWFKLGFAQQKLERHADAEKAYRRAVKLQPVFPEAWCNLGNELGALMRKDDAIAALRRAVAQRPAFPEAWRNLGVILEAVGRRAEALDCFERACEQRPDDADAHFCRAAALAALGRGVDAVAAYERVFELAPAHAGAYNNLGILFLDEHLLDDARACFLRALDADPAHAEALNNLGNVDLREQRFPEAAEDFRRALELSPSFVEALNGAGLAAQELGRARDAASSFRSAIALRPGFAEAHANLAMTLVQLGDTAAARQTFLHAAALSDDATLRLRAATLLPAIMGTKASIEADRQRIRADMQSLAAAPQSATEARVMKYLDPPFYFAYRGWNNRQTLSDLAALYLKMAPELGCESPHVGAPRTRSRVRVGFVSQYFFRHSVGMSFTRLIAGLAADPRLEIVGISLGHKDDEVTTSIRSNCAGWISPRGNLSSIRAAIASLDLDVLFYTDIGMDRITYPLSLSRLARVQCLSGGHPETSGSPNIDYLLSSRWLETPAAQAFYSEQLVLLDAYNSVLTRPAVMPDLASRAQLGLAGEHVYLCPVKLHKLHPDFDVALAALIERDPKACVVLFEDERQAHWRVLTEARQRETMGAAAGRVRFEPWADARTFQSWLQAADAVLDCWPFGMGTTAINALGQAIPVLTLPSERLSGRGTQALLRMMEIDWLVAADVDDFVSRAVTLAAEPSLRQQLAQDLRARSDVLFRQADCAAEMAGFLVESVVRKEAAA